MNVPEDIVRQFNDAGFAIVKGLFSAEEAAAYRDHYMTLRETGKSFPGDGGEQRYDVMQNDPLLKYGRIMHPHRWDDLSRDFLLAPRVGEWLQRFLGQLPYAVQTMAYFKPPTARGQALHQDQFYLRAQPGTCIAAWMALDYCDEENGCLRVVPKTHTLPTLCTRDSDPTQSFSPDEVVMPEDEALDVVPVYLDPGDVLFFNGQLIHGSYPNTSKDRFRRALIAHYVQAEAEKIGKWYHPALNFDGSEMTLEQGEHGGPCGLWVKRDGSELTVEVTGMETRQ